MSETDARWEPFPSDAQPKYVEAIHDDYEGFRILLRGETLDSPMLRLSFDPPPLAYRVTEEASWLSNGLPVGLAGSRVVRFLALDDSELLSWFRGVSAGIRDSWNLRHYVVCMANSVVEVVACQPPRADDLNSSGEGRP